MDRLHLDPSRDAPSRPARPATRTADRIGAQVLRLQRLAGNRATSSLFGTSPVGVQRDETDEDAETDEGGGASPQLDPEMARELRALFPSSESTYEVISASTGAQSTAGELTAGALATWRRDRIGLDEAYRRSADRSHRSPGHPGGRVEPTRGGGRPAGGQPPGAHWGLLLAAWNYPGGRSDLQDVRDMLRRGSPFRNAADATYDRHRIVSNPDGDGIRASIRSEIHALYLARGGGQLTVNFQGHGGGGAIDGVDWEQVSRRQLQELGVMAASWGVHVTFVLDTCNAGSAALMAENQEMADVVDSARDQPADVQAELRAAGEPLLRLTGIGLALNDIANQLRWAEVGTVEQRSATREQLAAGRARLDDLSELLRTHREIEGGAELRLLALSPDLTFRLLLDQPSMTRREVRRGRESLAPLLDGLNSVLGSGVDRLRGIAGRAPAR